MYTIVFLQVKCDLDRCVERANTLALGMRTVYVANIAHCKFITHLRLVTTSYFFRQYLRVAVSC